MYKRKEETTADFLTIGSDGMDPPTPSIRSTTPSGAFNKSSLRKSNSNRKGIKKETMPQPNKTCINEYKPKCNTLLIVAQFVKIFSGNIVLTKPHSHTG